MNPKFNSDAVFGLVGVAVLGLAGIVLNIIVARYYDTATLGAFNQVFAIYIFASQLATLGVQYGIVYYAPQTAGNVSVLRTATVVGIGIVALFGTAVSACVGLLSAAIGHAFESEAVQEGLLWMLPGLWAFALNKFLLNLLNGLQENKAYSLFNALRYLLLVGGALLCVGAAFPGYRLPVIFSWAEIMLLLGLLIYCRHQIFGDRSSTHREWVNNHISFGIRALPGGAFSELNTRVDVLMLGYFLNDQLVGVFSFAALIAEGLAQLPLVIKRQMDPLITTHVTAGSLQVLTAVLRRLRIITYTIMLPLALVSSILYPWVADLLTGRADIAAGWATYATLALGVVVQSGYVPATGLLAQAGYPTQQTFLLLLNVGTNVGLNLLFIPLWGVSGAALATAAALVTSTVYLRLLARRTLGMSL